MTEQKGVYEITNNEGMICFVDTATQGKKTFGKDWEDICKSTLEGLVLKAEILKYQYRTHGGEPIDDNPTGFVVKINGNIEAFLPFKLCGRFRESNVNYDGDIVAVMVDSFDPNSLSIIVRELTITDQDIDINVVNEALGLIGQAHIDGKYVRGTIVAEKKKWNGTGAEGRRVGYLVTINGIEAFLPMRLSYYPHWIDISHLIGTNIVAGVEEINIEKMTITLSMISPYENLIYGRPIPEKNEQTTGILTQVTPNNVCVLLPQNVMGIIPRYMYPHIEYSDFIKLTGCLINCIPFRVNEWDQKNNNRKMLVSFAPEGENNAN